MTSCNTGNGKPPSSTHASVKEYYGKVLQTSKDLKTSACTAGGRPHQRVQHLLSSVPEEVSDKFYGCGAPLPLGIEGLRVLISPHRTPARAACISQSCPATFRHQAIT